MTLGERIRSLRKERKMTLQQLAGTAITKGMLSLIENNKAKPSMESLQHIATMLEVPVSDLLEESSSSEKKEVVKRAEDLFSEVDYMKPATFDPILETIEPFLPSLIKGYMDARLLDLYSRAAYERKLPDWKTYSDKAIQLYDEIQVSRRAASLRLYRISCKFREKNYHEALELLENERKQMEESSSWTDPLSRLDFDYTGAVFYYAVGEKEKALKTMHDAIAFSKKQKVFYRLDHLYRLAVIHAMMAGDLEEAELYINRLEAYAMFTEDEEICTFNRFIWIHYYTTYAHDYEKAQILMDEFLEESTKSIEELDFERVEMAKIAYHMKRIEEAKDLLEHTEIPEIISHPIDLSMFSERDYYLAKIYDDEGRTEEALQLVQSSWNELQHYPETPYQRKMSELLTTLKQKMS